ncbi:MAG: SDR family NAD(P)-dependent oxidoreductase [Sneathiella sp.]|nr:SDR family NAD(P)-dependent oxidoreductase [Sneathiella sp.]
MPKKNTKCIVITGASSGIGAALAKFYAKDNVTLALCGRNLVRLEAVGAECERLGAKVLLSVVNVSNLAEVNNWIVKVNDNQSIDLVHVNAGITGGVGIGRDFESAEDVSNLLSTNLIGATNTIGAVIKFMVKSGKGQIVVTNSLAGYVGFPGSPAYCASKAGLRIYCESLQRSLKSKNIILTLVYPGYVDSPMSRKVISAKPLTKSVDYAAKLIAIAATKKKREMGFPYPMWIGVRLLGILPVFLQNIFVPIFDLQMDMSQD